MVGKIDIQEVTEHEDGSATVVFDCDDEARKALINEGLISLLEKAVSKENEEYSWAKDADADKL
jgi:ribosome biogenesis SPOUT family RNA methylase Rps3